MNGVSKEINGEIVQTTGLPKGSNPHGNRGFIVPINRGNSRSMGRNPTNTFLSNRHYGTLGTTATYGGKKSVIEILKSIHTQSIKDKDYKFRNVYKLMCRVDILSAAYQKLKSKPGNMTPGIVPDTLDGMSLDVLEEISALLRTEQFQFKPGRRVQIPKRSGGTRPLTIAPPRDKIVQEAMRMILEAIYEPTFSECSHGFRPSRGGGVVIPPYVISSKSSYPLLG